MEITITGYKGQRHQIGVDWHAVDEDGRGGRVVTINFDNGLSEYIFGVMPSSGPVCELRASRISFTAPPDKEGEA